MLGSGTVRRRTFRRPPVFADLSGYTRLTEEVRRRGRRRGRPSRSRSSWSEIATEGTVASIVKLLGDGVLLHFPDPGDAVRASLGLVDPPFEVGALVRPHVHTSEDEISIVLEGRIGFRSEDQEVVLGPGGYIIKPRNQVHAMWNAGGRAGAHDRGHQPRPALRASSAGSRNSTTPDR